MGLASIFRWNRISPFSRWGDLHTWGNCFCLSSLDQPYPTNLWMDELQPKKEVVAARERKKQTPKNKVPTIHYWGFMLLFSGLFTSSSLEMCFLVVSTSQSSAQRLRGTPGVDDVDMKNITYNIWQLACNLLKLWHCMQRVFFKKRLLSKGRGYSDLVASESWV